MGAAARGVLLLERDHVAGTHHAFFFAAALSYADAAHGGVPEIAFVFRKLEMRLRLPGVEVRPEAQVLVDRKGIDDLVGIHPILWIPDGLELSERLNQLRAEHFGQHLSFGLSISMLSRNGTTVADYQISGFIDECAVI